MRQSRWQPSSRTSSLSLSCALRAREPADLIPLTPESLPHLFKESTRDPPAYVPPPKSKVNRGQPTSMKIPKRPTPTAQDAPGEVREVLPLRIFQASVVFLLGQEFPAMHDYRRETIEMQQTLRSRSPKGRSSIEACIAQDLMHKTEVPRF